MVNLGFKGKEKYLETIDLVIESKKNGFYSDILGVAEKIPYKEDLTIKLGVVKSFMLNCPNVRKHIKATKPQSLDYLNAFKDYLRERALKEGDWFVAQEDLAKRLDACSKKGLDDCSPNCPLLPQ